MKINTVNDNRFRPVLCFASVCQSGTIDNYNIDASEVDDDDLDSIIEVVREYLEDNTSVCGQVSGGFIYAAF